ncbi:MCP four helix bundle domain-containing protein, partial [Enterococcus faecium]|uniref:MCP four helix bundle domain-containing protein n=1 Tax=Enterococcus faecium TaxID=1352 RepID=UPI0034E9753F
MIDNQNNLTSILNTIRELDSFYQTSSLAMAKLTPQMSNKERNLIERINQIEQRTLPYIEKIINAKSAGNTNEASSVLLNDARPAFTQWLDVINQFIKLQEQANQTTTQETRDVASSFELW